MRQAILLMLCTVLLGAFLGCGGQAAWARSPQKPIAVPLGSTEIITVGDKAADILVADPSIVDTGSMHAGELHVTGLKTGNTSISVFDDAGKLLRNIKVQVKTDTSAVQAELNQAFPKENITVDANGAQIVLTGTVGDAVTANKVRDLAAKLAPDGKTVVNRMTVSDNQQVMIKVKVVEVSRSVLNELGIESNSSGGLKGNFAGSNFQTAPSLGLTVSPSFGVGSLIYNTGSTGPIELIMRALERDGLVNTLAQPNLTAISGENARFLAGGEFPIPSQRDQNGNIQYEYKPFGVSLSFKPVVLSNERINLQIATEISEISTQLTLQLPGITVPSFSVRRAETTVELASGGSLMIAGLIQSQTISRLNALPGGVKDIPIFGALASSESFTRNESELLVMITAYKVEPFADTQATMAAVDAGAKKRAPLNITLVERLAAAYGGAVAARAGADKPFGYILD